MGSERTDAGAALPAQRANRNRQSVAAVKPLNFHRKVGLADIGCHGTTVRATGGEI